MRGVYVVGLNTRGVEAIRTHIVEKKKRTPAGLAYKALFSEELTSIEPYVLFIGFKNKSLCSLLKFEDIKAKISEALFKNGAKETDFDVQRCD